MSHRARHHVCRFRAETGRPSPPPIEEIRRERILTSRTARSPAVWRWSPAALSASATLMPTGPQTAAMLSSDDAHLGAALNGYREATATTSLHGKKRGRRLIPARP